MANKICTACHHRPVRRGFYFLCASCYERADEICEVDGVSQAADPFHHKNKRCVEAGKRGAANTHKKGSNIGKGKYA